MNKTKKSLISVLLAFIMLATCFATFTSAKSANALSDYYSEYHYDLCPTIYYFADSDYPMLNQYDTADNYPNYFIVYDTWGDLDADTLESLYNDGYFYGVDSECIFVFELTLITVAPELLEQIFQCLKEQGCVLIFVGLYDEGDYGFDIYEYVDSYVQVSGNKLNNFLIESIFDMRCNGLTSKDCILIDGRCVGITTYKQFERYLSIQEDFEDYSSFNQLYQDSLFLRMLLPILCDILALSYDEEYYQSFAEELYYAGFSLVVHIEDNYYVDILNPSWKSITFENPDGLVEQLGERSYFAIAFWTMSTGFYDFIFTTQNLYNFEMPLYLLEMEPFTYGNPGIDPAKKYSGGSDAGNVNSSIGNYT